MTSKFALVIANTEYQDTSFAKLTAPGKDAEEFAQVLRELAEFSEVQVLLNEGEGKTRRSIARFFAERKRDDLLLLYFSGHGIRNEQGQLFLAANDTELSILDASGIPADFITSSMNYSRSQRQLLILDCCNSGSFTYGSKSASAVGMSMGIATAFEGSGFGRVVLTATDATQYAWEGDKIIGDTEKSVFTHFLIEGLKGEADSNSDGRIDIDELYDYAYEQVVSRTPKQTPGKWSYKQQGDVILRENLKPHDVKPALLPAEVLELLSHPNSSIRRAGLQDLISLLDGKHLGLARAAQEKLKEIAENDDSLGLRKSASDILAVHGINLGQFVLTETHQEQEKTNSVLSPDVRTKQDEYALPKLKKNSPNLTTRLIGGFASILLLGVLLMFANSNSAKSWFGINSVNTATQDPNYDFGAALTSIAGTISVHPITDTPQPIQTFTLSDTQTSVATFTVTPALVPTLNVGSTMLGKDNMTLLYVPAGEFIMGSDNGNADEKPMHKVYLDDFWIDKTEVTVHMYYLCVADGTCKEPVRYSSFKRSRYYGNSLYDNYPVIYVNWNMAQTYCKWVNRRLPTEAEWEKAARGTNGFKYPWGDDFPNSDLLNYGSSDRDTTEVGTYPKGASPYGALDMAGNVSEWVSDWYSETYYANSPMINPLGPTSGESRVFRGGEWDIFSIRTSYRAKGNPISPYYAIGFRCAMSTTP